LKRLDEREMGKTREGERERKKEDVDKVDAPSSVVLFLHFHLFLAFFAWRFRDFAVNCGAPLVGQRSAFKTDGDTVWLP